MGLEAEEASCVMVMLVLGSSMWAPNSASMRLSKKPKPTAMRGRRAIRMLMVMSEVLAWKGTGARVVCSLLMEEKC